MCSMEGVRKALVYYFGKAAGFRAFLIPKDKPWNPKNEKYARALGAVIEHIEALPDDDPVLRMLADSESVSLDDIPDDQWQGVIHCETDDPAAWFEDWAKS